MFSSLSSASANPSAVNPTAALSLEFSKEILLFIFSSTHFFLKVQDRQFSLEAPVILDSLAITKGLYRGDIVPSRDGSAGCTVHLGWAYGSPFLWLWRL